MGKGFSFKEKQKQKIKMEIHNDNANTKTNAQKCMKKQQQNLIKVYKSNFSTLFTFET